MSDRNPYETLGVSQDASFEEIQEAKTRLTQQYQEDRKQVESIETAYDAIIMDRLRMRQEGKIKVPERIRFPEKSVETPPSFSAPIPTNSPAWLQGWLDRPSRNDILLSGGVFLGLGVLGFFNPPALSLAMALGFGANIYFINRKENRLGRAVLITLAGLVAGVGIGMALSSLGVLTGFVPPQFEAVGSTMLLFWLMSSFLR
ncbi:CPP1-like family protein [Oscillatoria sp. FACHB-1406]|uniref:CPP1-like family protein n=1 Tax=Oscillatoria sp. FACHB-1406 TaxID=2692846 RepID=UPI001687086A|nr:CPP1-like family protein [Oscillatoria sp. FACHB-1406]MBD2578903.1 CPP1-like family protein [Oscillatoria sp. FACHB-1406]